MIKQSRRKPREPLGHRELRDAGYVIVHRQPTESMLAAPRASGQWLDEDEAMRTFRQMVKESRRIQKRAMEKARREIEARSGQDTLFDLKAAI